ncbi:MAG: hypothetical protein JNL81_09455 [Hyphomonadaceae bacterium]|nr:hypothetical protein [Hyphomonadaceae bacterium]
MDNSAASKPDIMHDLNEAPWPWLDSSAEAMLFNHSLEHMGRETTTFLGIIQEIYRVGCDGAVVTINVPHPRHDNFLNDPTHVRAVTPEMLSMFDRQQNEQWVAAKASNTALGLYLGVDLTMTNVTAVLDDVYQRQLQTGAVKPAEISQLARERNNVIAEFRMELRVRKPAS